VTSASINSFSNVQARPNYYNIRQAETKILRRGPGTLVSIIINSGRTGSELTVYDNTEASGQIIAIVSTSTITKLTYDLDFYTGLTIVSVNTLGNFGNVTLLWN
jgi:hypothetical protein